MRIGFGYDIHPLQEGKPLILGGVSIPFYKGLAGHSDADVLCHAISDALLGAAALGDIGAHFPDTDTKYKNANSLHLLKEVSGLIHQAGFKIGNVDSTIVAEAPQLITYHSDFIRNLAAALEMDPSCISVKATTNEKKDAIGQGDAIAVYAIALIEPQSSG